MTTPVMQDEPVIEQLQQFRTQIEQEFNAILTWWIRHGVDEQYGGFYGSIDHHNQVDILAPKGVVLNSRILWTFSAAFNYTHQHQYFATATRAYEYLVTRFVDEHMGGVYWTLDHAGHPFDTDKKILAQAFTLYAFCEYYKATRRDTVIDRAIELYTLIERHGYDKEHEGYRQAFDSQWNPLRSPEATATSGVDQKAMNTQLHVLEAYINLFRIWPDENLRRQITRLVNNFLDHIIHPGTYHQVLRFNDQWRPASTVVSFGHDIATSWMLAESTNILTDGELIIRVKKATIQMAYAALRGLDDDGGMWYEHDGSSNIWVKEKHWWPQAEALVGFFHAWQLSDDSHFLQHTFNTWTFIREHILDHELGEWKWGVLTEASGSDKTDMSWEDKAGLWKCPYHNGRACLELLKRLDQVTQK